MENSHEYIAELSHDTFPEMNNIRARCRVTENKDGTRYVSAHPGGCSRDYPVADDHTAIQMLFAEHAARVRHIVKIN